MDCSKCVGGLAGSIGTADGAAGEGDVEGNSQDHGRSPGEFIVFKVRAVVLAAGRVSLNALFTEFLFRLRAVARNPAGDRVRSRVDAIDALGHRLGTPWRQNWTD
jgi:hypothetical protein